MTRESSISSFVSSGPTTRGSPARSVEVSNKSKSGNFMVQGRLKNRFAWNLLARSRKVSFN